MKIYLVEYSSCVFESGFKTIAACSSTKAAYNYKRSFLLEEWDNLFTQNFRYSDKGWKREYMRIRDKPFKHSRCRIRPIDVID